MDTVHLLNLLILKKQNGKKQYCQLWVIRNPFKQITIEIVFIAHLILFV